MRKYAIVLASAALVLMMGIGSASADETRQGSNHQNRPEHPGRPDIDPRCRVIGSGIGECDICWEDEASQTSICTKETVAIPLPDPKSEY